MAEAVTIKSFLDFVKRVEGTADIDGFYTIFTPPQNNERIIAQSGWFTAHAFSNSSKKFISLEQFAYHKKQNR